MCGRCGLSPPFQEALDAFSTQRTDVFVREAGEEVGLRPVPPPSTRSETVPADSPEAEDLDADAELIDSLAAYLILAELHLTGDCQDVDLATKTLPKNCPWCVVKFDRLKTVGRAIAAANLRHGTTFNETPTCTGGVSLEHVMPWPWPTQCPRAAAGTRASTFVSQE